MNKSLGQGYRIKNQEGGVAMREKGLESLEAQLGELSDPGGQGRVEQRLIDIINIASGGVIGGANSWETEGKAPIGWLDAVWPCGMGYRLTIPLGGCSVWSRRRRSRPACWAGSKAYSG